jgi:hypothetical protein
MPLHPVLIEKLNTAAGPASPPPVTRRDASLPAVPGKVHAVIAARRLLVLTRDQAIPIEASGVIVQPAYEWLLAESS